MFCKNCGNEMNDGETFCGKCGTPITNGNLEQQTVNLSDDNLESNREQKIEKNANSGCCIFTGIRVILIVIGVVWGLILVVSLIIIGIKHITHGKLDVKEVQEAYLEDYNDVTIGEAFKDYSYFSDNSWSNGTEQYLGKEIDIIVFNATIEMYDSYNDTYMDEPIKIQFMRNDGYDIEVLRIIGNGSTFFNFYEKEIIESIYQNEIVAVDTSDIFTWGQQ